MKKVDRIASLDLDDPLPEEPSRPGKDDESGLSLVVFQCEECRATLINPSSGICINCECPIQSEPVVLGPDVYICDGDISGHDLDGNYVEVEVETWARERENRSGKARYSDLPIESWVSLRKELEPEQKKAPWSVLVGDEVRARFLNKYDAVRLYDALRVAFEGNV